MYNFNWWSSFPTEKKFFYINLLLKAGILSQMPQLKLYFLLLIIYIFFILDVILALGLVGVLELTKNIYLIVLKGGKTHFRSLLFEKVTEQKEITIKKIKTFNIKKRKNVIFS